MNRIDYNMTGVNKISKLPKRLVKLTEQTNILNYDTDLTP